MTQKKKMPGEFQLIDTLTQKWPHHQNNLRQGVGDDCAVVRIGRKDWLITTDMLVESIHFQKKWTSAYLLGRKILSVNLSDIAAMGGTPRYAVIAAAFPQKTKLTFLKDLYRGLHAVAREHNVLLVGGDTNRSPQKMVFNITVFGEVMRGAPLLRSRAKIGDDIYITGPLGRSALGLKMLQKGKRLKKEYIQIHLNPQPKVQIGLQLSRQKINALIDLSDGLLSDLSHILKASGVGADLFWEKIPKPTGLLSLCQRLKISPEQTVLAGGEDYELLFTAPSRDRSRFKKFWHIGKISSKNNGLRVITPQKKLLQLPYLGYNHFSKKP
ncbi:MAG: thiamine-phosphate kinase [bacterium]|nr:thiamine-phosphate kinase [bacterium]